MNSVSSCVYVYSGTELDQLFLDAPCFEVPFDSGSDKKLVEVLHEASVFSSLGE